MSHPSPRSKPRKMPRPKPRPGPAVVETEDGLAPRWPDVTSVLRRQAWDALLPSLLKVGATPDTVMPILRRYCEMVLQWNRKVSNIISRTDEPRIVARHVLESLEPAHWLKESGATRWLDFGSGAGLPALPLAIAGVGGTWTLVESRRTKTLFLRKAVDEIGVRGITVLLSRLEDLVGLAEHAASYDGFTSRATETLTPTLAIAAEFVRPGGTAFLWKGSRREAEMAADVSWQKSWDFDGLLEIGGGMTSVARFRRK
jgi:16S rRNA (guanine527-N7)-methyltransferase